MRPHHDWDSFSVFAKRDLERSGLLPTRREDDYPYGEMVLELARCIDTQKHDDRTIRRVLNILLAEVEAYLMEEVDG